MDGSEGRLRMVGGPDDAAGIQQQQNSLGELGGWDPSHIERVDFSRTQGFNDNDVTSQGREYQGLMTAEDHRHKKEELDRILAWKEKKKQIDDDPELAKEYRRKAAAAAADAERTAIAAADADREARFAKKQAAFKAEQEAAESTRGVEATNDGPSKKIKKTKKKPKKARGQLSLSFDADEM